MGFDMMRSGDLTTNVEVSGAQEQVRAQRADALGRPSRLPGYASDLR